MKPLFKVLTPLFVFACMIAGCSKEGSGGATGDCNSNVQRLKKWQATFDDDHYMEATWNGDGTINTLKVNVQLSDYLTAKYIYSGGKIAQAALSHNHDGSVFDTVVYRYNNDGKVDSMWRKGDDDFGIRIHYTNGKISKLSRYYGANKIMYYFDIVTDQHGNVTKADEYWEDGASFEKLSTFTLTRDTRKNPLADLAPYMMYLNDEYEAFWYWGPNNMTDQRYQDFGGTGTDLTTGNKFKYNENCYPVSSQNTLMGQPIFTDDDFVITYY